MTWRKKETIGVPNLGQAIREVKVLCWRKSLNDEVNRGDVYAEISTDKVDAELEAPVTGRIVEFCAQPGAVLSVGFPLVVIETEEKLDGKHRALEPREVDHVRKMIAQRKRREKSIAMLLGAAVLVLALKIFGLI